jgi:MFS family permease
MIIAGWMIYALVYFGFAMSTSAPAFIAWFLFYGVYLRIAEGAEKALVADLTPPTGAARHSAGTTPSRAIGALIASVLFGELYEHFGAPVAFMTGARWPACGCVAAVHSHRYNQGFRCLKFWSPMTTAFIPTASKRWRGAEPSRQRHYRRADAGGECNRHRADAAPSAAHRDDCAEDVRHRRDADRLRELAISHVIKRSPT